MKKVTFPVQLEFESEAIMEDDDGNELTIDTIDAVIYEALSDYKDFAFDVADKVFVQMEGLSSSDYKLEKIARSMAFVLGKLQGLQSTVRNDLSKELQDEIKGIASEIETSLTKFNLMN